MLVFVSDLHLTDNTTCSPISRGAFRVFTEDLEWMAAQACRRAGADAAFRKLDRVDLVLLGDIFDLLRTNKWLLDNPTGVMPWSPEMAGDEHERARAHQSLAAQVDRIVAAAIEANQGPTSGEPSGLACLRNLVERGIVVEHGGETHVVPLYVWYMAGNHDWPLHVGRPEYDSARKRLREALGLAHPDDGPFAHTVEDLPIELRKVFEHHRVYAQHGDLFDPDNFQIEAPEPDHDAHVVGVGRRARSSLGDAIVIRLLNELPKKILAAMDADDRLRDDPQFQQALQELDNVRPLLAMPQWLAGVLQRYESNDKQLRELERRRRKNVHRALTAALDEFVADPFVRRFDRPWHRDTVDALQFGALFNRGVSLETLSSLSMRYEHRLRPESYHEHAEHQLSEMQSYTGERPVDFVVYGHTHRPEVVPLDVDEQRSWVYLNSGTWRRVHRRCVGDKHHIKFVDYHVMSLVAIYAGDERQGRPYETWSGTLGLRPAPLTSASNEG